MHSRRPSLAEPETAPVAPAALPPLLTRPFVTLLTAQAGFGYAFSSFLMLPKFMATELQAGPSTIGLVAGVSGAAVVVCMFAVGGLVDRHSRRPFLTGGAVLMFIASLAFIWVDRVGPLIYALRVLQALSFAMAFTAGAALCVDEAPPERLGQAIGFFGLSFLSLNAIAPLAVEALSERFGWASAFAAAAGGAALCGAVSLFVRDRRSKPLPHEEVPGVLDVLLAPHQLRLAGAVALIGCALGTVFTFHQPFALELGIERVGSLLVAYALSAIGARLLLGRLIDRIGRRRVATLVLVPYGLVVIAMMDLGGIGLAPLGALFGLSHGIFYPALNAVAVEDAGEHERGKVMAIFQGWFNLGLAGGSFALGFVAEAYGYSAVFLAAGVGVFLALAILLTTRGRQTGIRSA